jgi:hypothetical protein
LPSGVGAKTYLPIVALLLIVSIVLLGGSALLLAHYGLTNRPEIVVTMVILVGIVVLLISIAAFVSLLHQFGLADGRFALGLPDGSVRAILALGLLLIFSMISVFLYWDTAHPDLRQSLGITADQLAHIQKDAIVSILPGASPETFNVETVISGSQAPQLGQQLVTILGTLVTAIAAFYFGATTVASATGVGSDHQRRATPSQPGDQDRGAATATQMQALKVRLDAAGNPDPDVDLFVAISQGDIAAVRSALERGADPQATDSAVLARHADRRAS